MDLRDRRCVPEMRLSLYISRDHVMMVLQSVPQPLVRMNGMSHLMFLFVNVRGMDWRAFASA